MTPASYTRRFALLAALASSLWLAACGGGGSSDGGQSSVRAINLTSDVASLDLYVGDPKVFSGLASDAVAAYAVVDANTYTVTAKNTVDGATLFAGSYSVAKDQHYTAVGWGRQSAMRVGMLPEENDSSAITAGYSQLRVYNATIDTGAVDVYVTSSTADLGESTASVAAVSSGALSGFRDLLAGTYRLRITGVGDPNDIRLDVPAITLGAQQYATLVITAGSGGVLVNGTLIVQQAGTTTMKNTKARLRVVASVDGNGLVAASLGGATVAGGLRSPSLGSYTLVDSGEVTPVVTVNGAAVSPVGSTPTTYAAGADYTLLAYGAVGAGKYTVITDDNRLPSLSTRVKIRLVNGVNGSDPLTLLVDSGQVPSAVSVVSGTASPYNQIASSSAALLEVDSPTRDPVYLFTDPTTTTSLLGQGVYTVFVLSGNTTPLGRKVKER
jgi:hypothetical protein